MTSPIPSDAAPIPSAPTPTPSTTPSEPSAPSLVANDWTRRFVVAGALLTVCLSILGAVGVMCYRAALDGNAPATQDITNKLTIIALVGVGALIAALFGSNSLISKLLDKLM